MVIFMELPKNSPKSSFDKKISSLDDIFKLFMENSSLKRILENLLFEKKMIEFEKDSS